MTIRLQAIAFNHDPFSLATNALSLRKNATEFVTVPEWRRGFSTRPEDSPAAYAIRETRGQRLTVRVRLATTDPRIRRIEVRAVDPTRPRPTFGAWPVALSGRLPWLAYGNYPFYPYGPGAATLAAGQNVLGEVKSRVVQFRSDGTTGFELFDLEGPRLSSSGVGRHDVRWLWQYRFGPGLSWQDFATSRHRIYVVLESPNGPWRQFPYALQNLQLPWTEVLDYACQWAEGTHTLDDAATSVTHAVNQLGPDVLRYGCEISAVTQYTDLVLSLFDCTSFLELLRGGFGQGPYVNCTDCSTIVSTFSNALGCDLWQARMGDGSIFELNPGLAIGRTEGWRPACGWLGFSMHEVAWKWPCTANEEVYDACVMVDADPEPTRAPHTPLLPSGLRFGNPGDGQYRDRLATPAGRPSCVPQAPFSRQQRLVTDRLVFSGPPFAPRAARSLAPAGARDRFIDNLKQRHGFGSWCGRNTLDENLYVWRFLLSERALPAGQLRGTKRTGPPPPTLSALTASGLKLPALPYHSRSIWRPAGKSDAVVLVDAFECASRAVAHLFLVHVLGEFQSPLVAREKEAGTGDVAFTSPGDAVIVFARANIVFLIRNAAEHLVSVTDVARRVDNELVVKPGSAPQAVRPRIRRFRTLGAEARVGARLPLELRASHPRERSLTYKFLSRSGEVSMEEDRLVYRANEPGLQEVTVYAASDEAGATKRRLRFEAS